MSDDRLEESAKAIGPLYPVLVDKFGKLIDGNHRKIVDPNWPALKLEWVDDDLKRIKAQIHANVIRRVVPAEEKSKLLGDLAKATKWGPKQIAEFLGMSYQWVTKYLPDEYKMAVRVESGRQGGDAFALRRREKLPQEIIIKPQPEQALDTPLPQTTAGPVPPFVSEVPSHNIFPAEPTRSIKYGRSDFPGNCSGTVVKNLLQKYAVKGIVLDPMAGSGTTIDVCKELGLECLAFDVQGSKWRPTQKDILEGDARSLDQMPDESVNFVFCHFPYWNMYRYSDDARDLSTLGYDEFLAESEKAMVEAKRVLKPNCLYAVMMGDLRRNGRLYDLPAEFSMMGQRHFTLYDKIVKIGDKQRSNGYNYGGGNLRFFLLTFETILVFRKKEGDIAVGTFNKV